MGLWPKTRARRPHEMRRARVPVFAERISIVQIFDVPSVRLKCASVKDFTDRKQHHYRS